MGFEKVVGLASVLVFAKAVWSADCMAVETVS